MYETDRIIKTTDKDGNEVEIEIPDTPPPQILLETFELHQTRPMPLGERMESADTKTDNNKENNK